MYSSSESYSKSGSLLDRRVERIDGLDCIRCCCKFKWRVYLRNVRQIEEIDDREENITDELISQ